MCKDIETLKMLIDILNGLYRCKVFRFEEGVGTFTVYMYNKEYYSGNNGDGYAYLKIIMLLNYEIWYHSRIIQNPQFNHLNIEAIVNSMIHSIA